jgi:hypothetical protein
MIADFDLPRYAMNNAGSLENLLPFGLYYTLAR